jgi:hypothetical protein
MEQIHMLWRVQVNRPDPISDQERLQAGLGLHLAHAPLTSVLVQIGTEQQSYVAIPGCPGCRNDRCVIGCHSAMLKRLLVGTAPGLTLRPVTTGLSLRPYRRVIVTSFQGLHALPAATLLARWREARLQIGWRWCQKRAILGALLAVGSDGPDPAVVLREHHCQIWPIPNKLSLRWATAPIPWVLPLGQTSTLPPTLLLPASRTPTADHDAKRATTPAPSPVAEDEALATWLRTVMETAQLQPQTAPETSAGEETPSPWPTGPNGLPPLALGTLIQQILAEPSFRSTRKGQSGISKGRLVGLKHPALGEQSARMLMVWLDRAALLVAPESGQSPWRAPRPLSTDDLDEIAARLRKTPLPTSEEIRAAYGGES